MNPNCLFEFYFLDKEWFLCFCGSIELEILLLDKEKYHLAKIFYFLDQNLLEHLAFEKDRERMHEGCVTENPFFAFDKVCIFFLCRSF